MRQRIVSQDGFRWRVLEADAAPDGEDGPLVVLLHGFTGTADVWRPLVSGLTSWGPVLAPDMPGHGGTDVGVDPGDGGPLRPLTMEACADRLADVAARRGPRPLVVIGYSMGGRAALTWALRRPDQVAGLVLEGTSFGIPSREARERRRREDEALAQFIEKEGVPAFVKRWERVPLFASQRRLPEKVQAALRRRRLDQRAAGLAASLRGMGAGAMRPLWHDLPRLKTPTLLLAGELDEKYRRLARRMEEAMPEARAEIVAEAGHAVHVERPEAWRRAVTAFLRQVRGGR